MVSVPSFLDFETLGHYNELKYFIEDNDIPDYVLDVLNDDLLDLHSACCEIFGEDFDKDYYEEDD